MKRRTFIRGAISAAVAASLPGGDGYTYRTYETAEYWGPSVVTMMEPAQRMANALARSMMQTKEMVGANVFNRGGSTDELEGDV
jgi:hypothetical protein